MVTGGFELRSPWRGERSSGTGSSGGARKLTSRGFYKGFRIVKGDCMLTIDWLQAALSAALASAYDNLSICRTCGQAIVRGVMPRPH